MFSDVKKDCADIKMSVWMKVFLFTGLACYAPLFVCAAVGIIRGYSVQSWVPFYVAIAGQLILLVPFVGMTFFLNSKMSKYKNQSIREYGLKEYIKIAWIQFLKYGWFFFFSMFISILGSEIGMKQGRYKSTGDDLLNKGEYSAAIGFYEKELNTWYLRLRYNYNEALSSFGIAQSYCQMEKFDQARETYRLMTNRYKGYYKRRSAQEAAELDLELANISALQEQFGIEADGNKKASILFDIAIAYRRVGCNQKAREQYEIIQTLDVHQVFLDNAKKFAAGLDGK